MGVAYNKTSLNLPLPNGNMLGVDCEFSEYRELLIISMSMSQCMQQCQV